MNHILVKHQLFTVLHTYVLTTLFKQKKKHDYNYKSFGFKNYVFYYFKLRFNSITI